MGQAKGFVTTDFASQIAEIKKGKKGPVIKVCDLSAFVADVEATYVALIEKDVLSCVCNICPGKARKMEEIRKTLIALAKVDIKGSCASKITSTRSSLFCGCLHEI